jgi:hypothetical protein
MVCRWSKAAAFTPQRQQIKGNISGGGWILLMVSKSST